MAESKTSLPGSIGLAKHLQQLGRVRHLALRGRAAVPSGPNLLQPQIPRPLQLSLDAGLALRLGQIADLAEPAGLKLVARIQFGIDSAIML